MRTLKLIVAYDGTRYSGWQVQPRRRTIQETLQQVLTEILGTPTSVIGSGRTDAGVHAHAQVAHMRTRSTIPAFAIRRRANQLLPRDIAILAIEEVDPSFHAQFGARRKFYRYRIRTNDAVSPFDQPYVHVVHSRLNAAAMRREAAAMRGTHDFRAFARQEGKPRKSTRRTIYDIRLRRRPHELWLDVEGNGFLHTMIRTLAGTLIDVGRGHLPEGTIRTMLTRKRRDVAGKVAPAKGLTLMKVTYS